MSDIDPNLLKEAFNQAQTNDGGEMKYSPEETEKFKKAFDDPEFRKMFAEYMDELQDPKHRAETEAYISQIFSNLDLRNFATTGSMGRSARPCFSSRRASSRQTCMIPFGKGVLSAT